MRKLAYIGLWLMTLCLASGVQAQTIGQWEVYPSYMDATRCAALDKVVYTQTAGNLFMYDTEDESLQLFNSMAPLSDVSIAQMGASQEAGRVIVVYENCNIDLLDNAGNVLNIRSLKDKALSGKVVECLTVRQHMAYIGMGFGFLEVDLREGVIRDTYTLGIDVLGILLKDDNIYLATPTNTVYVASEKENLHIMDNWKVTTAVKKKDILDQASQYVPAGGLYWRAEGMDGLRGYRLKDGKYELAKGPIQPNSPVRDLFYRMHYVTNAQGDYRLLVAGGTNTNINANFTPTAMYFENGEWTSMDESPAETLLPGTKQCNTTDLVQDPNDDTHHFAGTWRNGLKEYRNNKLVNIYTSDNSPIEVIKEIGREHPRYHQYECATASQYDREGNLWIANQYTDTVIRYVSPEWKWHALYYEELKEVCYVSAYLFSHTGVNFMACQAWPVVGVFAFDINGTPGNLRDDKHRLFTILTNQDGTDYEPLGVQSLTEDLDGRIWVATGTGLFVIEDPRTFFDDDFTFTQIKIPRNDGSGLADYLLNGVCINCVAVDGGNRKWIGTQGDGVYLISPDGLEMIHHFTKDDSPLLSNNVQCIAIHPVTGQVMIGTDVGLCSYVSDATEPEEDLQYDNVLVYPNPITPQYNGPITIKGLTLDSEVKICSATGQLVWSGRSNGGTFTWNGRTHQGKRVASGVYNVIANTQDGKKAIVTRIMVVK